MSGVKEKVEVIANVSIILLALALGAVLLKKYLVNPTAQGNTRPVPKRVSVGDKISLNDIDFAKAEQTLLIALSKSCRFCSESGPFYQRLIGEIAQQQNIRCFFLFPHSVDEGKKYLDDLSIVADQVKQVDFESLQVTGTPTLILLDKNGVVTNVWVGKLEANQEEEVLAKLRPCPACD
ncbi:MAG TPA: hypothetical protein VNN73_02795 [Blastocatellia bacterium]|nr:hypothetical protein [Blastocatellia bacterium]